MKKLNELTLPTVIDDTRCHLVLPLDLDHVEYYELDLEFLVLVDPVQYPRVLVHSMMVACKVDRTT